MRTLICILFSVFLPVLAYTSASAAAPHARIYGIWAYGEEVTDSARLDHKQNNLRFFCGTRTVADGLGKLPLHA